MVYFVREKIYVVLDLEGIFLPPLLDPAWPPRSPSMKLFFTKTMMSSQSTSQDESFVLECKKFLRGLCLLLFMATKSPQYDSFFSNFRFFLMEKTNERNVHGPKGMVILHNFMCSLLPCLFVFQNVCLFRSVLLMIFAAIFR